MPTDWQTELQDLREIIAKYIELGENSYLKEVRRELYLAALKELDDQLYYLVCRVDEGKL